MTATAQDYSIVAGATSAVLGGVMRLASVEAYDVTFAPLRAAILATPMAYRIDLGDVVFMNSSGIRALAGLVLVARDAGRKLVIAGKKSVPWQSRTLLSLQSLDKTIELVLA